MKNNFESPKIELNSIDTLYEMLLNTATALSKTNMELKETQKNRNEMLANISHDLRAPITAIRSAVDLLTSGHSLTEEEFNSTLMLIDRRTKTLEDLIQDMYFLFCVEDTSRAFEISDIDITAFLEEYFYDAIIDNRYDNHDMQLDIDDELFAMVRIDIQKFIRVLDNLLTNAAKYSGEATTITLSASLDKCHENVIVSVADNGIGIPAESLEMIFSRTYTVSSARTPNSSTGSGLGLAIVKTIVERLDGTIRCESEVAKGSTFIITLPIIH